MGTGLTRGGGWGEALSPLEIDLYAFHFSCHVAPRGTSSTMLNKRVRADIIALFIILGGKHLIFQNY